MLIEAIKSWWDDPLSLKQLSALTMTAIQERDVARDALRLVRVDLAAAELQLAAEKQDNEALRANLKTTRAGLDHATRCYEQCEADRQALAKERDAAKADLARATQAYAAATRDLERIHLISFEHVTGGTFATPGPTETAGAGPDHANEANPVPRAPVEPSRCIICHGVGCQWCLGHEPAKAAAPPDTPPFDTTPTPKV